MKTLKKNNQIKEGSKHKTRKYFTSEFECTITCRGCKDVHLYFGEIPTELTCKCEYIIAADGKIWPTHVTQTKKGSAR